MNRKYYVYIFVFLFSVALYQDLHPNNHQQNNNPPDGIVLYRGSMSSVIGTAVSPGLMLATHPYVQEVIVDSPITYQVSKSIEINFTIEKFDSFISDKDNKTI